MDEKDVDAIYKALGEITGVEGMMNNLKSRGPRAAKIWKAAIPKHKADKKQVAILKQAVTDMGQLLKLIAKSENDIQKILKVASPKNIALFPSKDVFKKKVAPFFKTIVMTEREASKLKIGLSAKTGMETMFFSSKEVDVKATIQAIEMLVHHSNALRVNFAKL